MADTDTDIRILNSLITTTLDSRKGFLEAAKDAENSQFSQVFREFADERSQAAALLQAEVRRQGGEPEDDSSMLAAAHRSFMKLKEVFVSRDDKAIAEEVERGEDYIKAKYEKALAEEEISGSARAAIQEAYISVRAGHDRARALRDSLVSART